MNSINLHLVKRNPKKTDHSANSILFTTKFDDLLNATF